MRSPLESLSLAELERTLRTAPAPGDGDLIGDFDGRILQPRWLAAAAAWWAGKRVERRGGRLVGTNRVRWGGRILHAVRFEVRTLPSPFDGAERRTLVYPGGLVRDELVRVDDALLGRGFVGRGSLPVYFTLRRSEP